MSQLGRDPGRISCPGGMLSVVGQEAISIGDVGRWQLCSVPHPFPAVLTFFQVVRKKNTLLNRQGVLRAPPSSYVTAELEAPGHYYRPFQVPIP